MQADGTTVVDIEKSIFCVKQSIQSMDIRCQQSFCCVVKLRFETVHDSKIESKGITNCISDLTLTISTSLGVKTLRALFGSPASTLSKADLLYVGDVCSAAG